MKCYIFDIDGTLANGIHRLHLIQQEPKDWDAYFDLCSQDKPIKHMIELCKLLFLSADILFVSGRSERVRSSTEAWLSSQGLHGRLYMRPEGDHRDDDIIKSNLLDQLLADGYEPIMVFDDRTRVVKMWRARGIPCAQVAEGDF